MTTPAPAVDDAAAHPWPDPRGAFLFFLAFAAIGGGMAQLVPAVLTLSLKAAQLDPDRETTILSIAVGVGAVFALVAAPVFGRLSDRITWRTGRRRPLLVLGAVLYLVGAPIMYAAPDVAVLTAGTIVTMVGVSAVTVACTAVLADQYPPERRGPASALVGLGLPVGAVVGLFLAQLVSASLLAQFLVPALVASAAAILLTLRLDDRVIDRAEVPHRGARDFFGTFWVNPVRHPSFGFAWASRLLLFFGVASVQAYQAFYLIREMGYSTLDVSGAVFASTLVMTVMALAFAALFGRVSDRVGRRKPFVVAAAVIFAVGLVLVTAAETFPAFLGAMAVVGVGQGVYMAVDLALVSEVLPDQNDIAKDMGIMWLASSLPNSIVPAVAPALLAIGAGAAGAQNFPALFLAGAAAALLGALLILPIRGTR
ncbi:MFS transporter [Isoptericola sp. F-RaC21]|uniref:MFS transporter n=1 Tax=Isoptericola sp. F-RaC21 TaxID=3141452 RepID=UPI00315C448A